MEEIIEEKVENNSEKTNNKYTTKRAIGTALIISIVLSIILTIVIFIISMIITNTKPHSNSYVANQEAQAHNGQFKGYFGDKVSASDVKALIAIIRSNNITSQMAEETKAIGIKFQGPTGNAEILAPSAASKKIIAGRTYFVGTENEDQNQDDENPTIEGAKDTNSAYYKSRYLRIITIKENPGN